MTTRAIGRRYDRALAEVGVRQVAYAILGRLDAEGPLSINELASRLALERTTCSREVAPLVRAGLIEVGVGDDRPTAGCAVVRRRADRRVAGRVANPPSGHRAEGRSA
jgi:DNA-binding IclR family transcriptional regulator